MTIEERLAKLEKEIEDLRQARDIVFAESARKRLSLIGTETIDTDVTDINGSTVIGAGGGTVNHPAVYDKKVRVLIGGSIYELGVYNP